MKVLECSSKGDKRFSAFYAHIKLFNEYDSIENFYQLSKRFGTVKPKTWRNAKGKKPTHLIVKGIKINIKYTEAYYDLMWLTYLDNHLNLVKYAKSFDDYSDMFKSKTAVVCQADSIRKYIIKGRDYILKEHKEFIDLLKEK